MILPAGVYGFADLEAGHCLRTETHEITAALIDDFARVSGDHYEIHMSDAAAQARGFPARVAHGLLVLSVIDGLKNNAPARFDALASLGWEWKFSAPVFASDSVRAEFTVREKRRTSSGARGIVTIEATAFNQRDEVVQEGQNRLIFDL